MIRFIDLRDQGTGYRFAFWDTVTDQFLQFSGEQAWDDADDFCRNFNHKGAAYGDPEVTHHVERFLGLMPGWAFGQPKDHEERPCLLENPECAEHWLALKG